jgi:hypothetical protein
MSDPTITLAGRQWRVPLLAPRQNRIVLPALLTLGTTADYALLLDIVLTALTRASPGLDESEFEDAPLPLSELIDALPVVASATGLLETRTSARRPAPQLPDWNAIIAECCNFRPGTTEEYYEDHLTAPRLAALCEEWRKHPPPALLAAASLGYRPRPRDEDALAELIRLFPHGRLRLNGVSFA